MLLPRLQAATNPILLWPLQRIYANGCIHLVSQVGILEAPDEIGMEEGRLGAKEPGENVNRGLICARMISPGLAGRARQILESLQTIPGRVSPER